MRFAILLSIVFFSFQSYAIGNRWLQMQAYQQNLDGSISIENPFVIFKNDRAPLIHVKYNGSDITQKGVDTDCSYYGLGSHVDWQTKEISVEDAELQKIAGVTDYPKLSVYRPNYQGGFSSFNVYTELTCAGE